MSKTTSKGIPRLYDGISRHQQQLRSDENLSRAVSIIPRLYRQTRRLPTLGVTNRPSQLLLTRSVYQVGCTCKKTRKLRLETRRCSQATSAESRCPDRQY